MKRPPRLDFQGGPPRPWIGLAACTFALLLLAASAWHGWRQQQDNAARAGALAQRQARSQAGAPRMSPADRQRLAQANRLAAELRAPWGELLSTFETQGGPDIGLLKLEPDARTGVVRVTGHARNASSLFAYLKSLEADARLRQVALVNHELEQDTPGRPLRFVLQAGWREAVAPAKDPS
jgi:Tfp pilus assembly protein PilN